MSLRSPRPKPPSLGACVPMEVAHEPAKQGTHPAIVITGAGSGTGKEIARLAMLEGSFLLLVDGARRELDELVAELTAQHARVVALCIGSDRSGMLELIENALAEHDLYCDMLVNSGLRPLFGPAANTPLNEQLRIIAADVRAMTELTLRFLPGMVLRGRGGILNIGSVAGYAPVPNMAVYAASKAFVNSFTAALGTEFARTGVSVTCVVPGMVLKPFLQRYPRAPAWLLNLIPPSSGFDAAVAAWLAFKSGQHLVMPKWTSRVAVIASRLLQDSIVLRFLGALQRPADAA